MIVCKFGGKATMSIQGINNIKKLAENNDRKVFVFSAIGKSDDSEKMTDLLIKYANSKSDKVKHLLFSKIEAKFKSLIAFTKIQFSLEKELLKIRKSNDKSFIVSRGEFITSSIMARFLYLKFIPAERLIIYKNKQLCESAIRQRLKRYLKKYGRIVTSGFYGIDCQTHKIVLFERGGGDLTGGIIAKNGSATIYENFTDVSGIKCVNPQVINNNITINKIDYKTLALFSDFGFNVFQRDACEYLQNTSVVTKVRNVFQLCGPITNIDNKPHVNTLLGVKETNNKALIVVKTHNQKTIQQCGLIKFNNNYYFGIVAKKQKIRLIKILIKYLWGEYSESRHSRLWKFREGDRKATKKR